MHYTFELSTLGRFGCVLKLDGDKDLFRKYFIDIYERFDGCEVAFSRFHVDTDVCDFEDFDVADVEDDGSVWKVIFDRPGESLIMDYFESIILIEHIVRSVDVGPANLMGVGILAEIANGHDDPMFIAGYELSIFANAFSDSLNEAITDRGYHPLVVASVINGQKVLTEYNHSGLENVVLYNCRRYLNSVLELTNNF